MDRVVPLYMEHALVLSGYKISDTIIQLRNRDFCGGDTTMHKYYLGIDIGSTTAKAVLTDRDGHILYRNYQRHNAEVFKILLGMLREIEAEVDSQDEISVLFTGTAGMGVAERSDLPFVQEVVASGEVIKTYLPDVRTFIDLGGEDAKIIFFDENMKPDIRMNGNCAGGTGAFIDQMAELLHIPVDK